MEKTTPKNPSNNYKKLLICLIVFGVCYVLSLLGIKTISDIAIIVGIITMFFAFGLFVETKLFEKLMGLIGWIIGITIIGFLLSWILTPIISEIGTGTAIIILLLFGILHEMEKANEVKQNEIWDRENSQDFDNN